MAAVYSRRLLESAGGIPRLYLVEAGTVVVLRWLTVVNNSAFDHGVFNLQLEPELVALAWGLMPPQGDGAGSWSRQIEMRTVIQAGESVSWTADGVLDATLSGYVLTLP